MTDNSKARASNAIEVARDVIGKEAAALTLLADNLPAQFTDAVDLLVDTGGHLVITGIGKSGLIGRKLAATFSATGSPAFFVHAAEAAHGDLGMIKPGDTLIVLSNSGASAELRWVLNFARSANVPIIAIGARERSQMMQGATVPLLLPTVAEACPEKIAPTTSTAMMLALGDALAIAAMQRRGVTRSLLVGLHPGGSIGFGNLPVDALIENDSPLPLVRAETPMRDVVLEITSARKGVAGVVDDRGRLIGVVSDGDLRRSFDKILLATAGDVMGRAPKTTPSGTLIGQALETMRRHEITALFVMREDDPARPKGVVNIHDLSGPA